MTLLRHARQVPPGPSRRETIGLLRKLATDRLTLMTSAAEKYGDAVRMAIGPKTLYFFNHPEHAKHVLADNSANYRKGIGYVEARRALGDGLLTSDGALWREQRRTIQPVFQHKRIAAQADVIVAEASALVARLRSQAGQGPTDLFAELTRFTLNVLGRTLLDADLSAFDSVGHSFEAVQDQAMFEMESMGMVPMWLPLARQRRFRRARQDLYTIVDQLVVDRLADPHGPGDDVLSQLIESTRRESDPQVSRRRLRDELITLLLAGHETTASTVGWALYLIDQHPEVATRLHAEALEILSDRPPVNDDLHKLRYTAMVLHESMRLYPPVWMLTRRATDADEIGGYHVPAGADVLICPFTLHRHPDFWDAPERFDPDRFDPDRPANRPRYAYLPFGAGPRFCVGSHLGLMEATFVVAMIARELRLSLAPGHDVVAEPMLSLRIRGGLPMIVHPAVVPDSHPT